MRTKWSTIVGGMGAFLATLPAIAGTRRRQGTNELAVTLCLALGGATAVAQTWDETTNGGGDARNLMPGQVISGSGPLTAITGRLSGFAIEDPSYPNYDFVDLYRINISDEANFSATTVAPSGSGILSDTQLWLFDASGIGISYNNNAPGLGALSRLTSANVPSNGVYFLGVSNWTSRATNGALQLIWNYDGNLPGLEWAPNGPGAPGPLGMWTSLDGGQNGRYRVDLTGASLPEPTSLALLGIGGLIVLRKVRRTAP